MNNTDFEGYTGLFFFDSTYSNDLLIVLVLILLTVFSWNFRSNISLFRKMISNINAGEQQSIFETTEKDSFLFSVFMIFQTFLLVGIFLFAAAVRYQFISNPTILTTLLAIGILLLVFSCFYLFKQALYSLFGSIFFEKSTNKMLFTNYQALFCTWGITLYIPVLLILLFDSNILIPVILR